MAPRYELAIGLNKGHKTTKIRVAKNKSEKEKTVAIRPARLKGVSVFFYGFCCNREVIGHLVPSLVYEPIFVILFGEFVFDQ